MPVTQGLKRPPYLQPGDTVAITCPAGAVDAADIAVMAAAIEARGFRVVLGKTIGTSYYKFSAPDAERAADLQQFLDDPNIKAIFFGRGGYGVVRIIDQLDFNRFNAFPKWLIGYSDITCILNHVQQQYGIAGLHAHMQGGYQVADYHALSTDSLFDVLCGHGQTYVGDAHPMNRFGESAGELCGGNLALLSDLVGTPSEIDTDGKILFIEDIAEYKYNIDRMLWQYQRAGKLARLKGLLVGGFTDTQDNAVPFGMDEYQMVAEKVAPYNYPVVYGFPVGHQAENYALVCGASYRLQVHEHGWCLSRQP